MSETFFVSFLVCFWTLPLLTSALQRELQALARQVTSSFIGTTCQPHTFAIVMVIMIFFRKVSTTLMLMTLDRISHFFEMCIRTGK